MNTTPDDPMLRRLSTIRVDTTAPALAELQLRGRQIRRRHARRRALTAGGVAVVLGAAGFTSPHLPWLDGGSQASAGPTCGPTLDLDAHGIGPAFWVPEREWNSHVALRSALRLLPDQVPTLVGLHDDGQCPPTLPIAVLYDHKGGRGITIWSGSDEAADFVARQPGVQHTAVGDRPATITTISGGPHHVAWTTADGTPRYAEAHGMSADQLRATLATLRFTPDGVDATSVPSGYESAPVPPSSREPDEFTWFVDYDSKNQIGSTPDYSAHLEITTAPHVPLENALSTRSDLTYLRIGGRTATWSPPAEGGARLTWTTAGAHYQLAVPGGTLEEMVRLAQSLTPAADDDPRVTQAQGHGW